MRSGGGGKRRGGIGAAARRWRLGGAPPLPRRQQQQRRSAPQRLAAITLLAAAALLLLRPAAALKITIHPAATECLTEAIAEEHFLNVQGGPRVEGAFFIGSKEQQVPPTVSVQLYSPSGELIWSQAHAEAEAHFNVGARGAGNYRVCFTSHTRVDVAIDLVYFAMGHLRRPGQVNVPKGSQETRGKELARKDHLDEVKRQTVVVGELVDILSGEQRYLQRKLERHMQTCHSNNRRTLWYTVLEVLTLCGVSAFNAWFVSNLFKGRHGGGPRSIYGGRIVV